MKLPTKAVGDSEGLSTYPWLLTRFGAADLLHLALEYEKGGWTGTTLCGSNGSQRPAALVEYLGDRAHPVCVKCRRVAEARVRGVLGKEG